MRMNKPLVTVALAGNPNSGKTTMFNLLTGARQKIGNYPGVTVECREGMIDYFNNTISFIDLPGIYSLSAYSPEELVAQRYLLHEKPHIVIVVVDSTALERSLYFILQLMELNIKVIVALNMLDEAKNSGITINIHKLRKKLNLKIIPTIARKGIGKDKLLETIINTDPEGETIPLKINYGRELEHIISRMEELISAKSFLNHYPNSRAVAIRYLENDSEIMTEGDNDNPAVHEKLLAYTKEAAQTTLKLYNYTPESIITDQRYGYIASIINNGIIYNRHPSQTKKDITKIADKILTSPFLGTIFLCLILYTTFWFATSLSEGPMQWIEKFFEWLTLATNQLLPQGDLNSLITNGILSGIGSVLSFIPIIGLMFIAISLLEDSGYMARMSYMLDRVFRIFGLHGNSIISLIVSGGIGAGCAVPGVMATRTLKSHKEKIATILTAPIMSCGAKLPVFILLATAFFPHYITEALFIITVLSWLFVLAVARFLRSTILTGSSTPFLMELPPYRLPTFKGLLIHAWERVWQYIKKAGTVILGITIILWASMSYPVLPQSESIKFHEKRQAITNSKSLSAREKTAYLTTINNKEAELQLYNSYAGKLGRAMEPVSKLAGFDWKINISLVGGLAAKEVIISTLATAFSLKNASPSTEDSLTTIIQNDKSFTKATAISLILFTMLYAPCLVTVIVIGEEAGFKWAVFSVIFNTFFAFIISSIFYQLISNYLHT